MKSVEIKFTEALAALDKAGKRSKFDAKLNDIKERANGKLPTIEVQLNLADETLKESRIIAKHNGAAETFVEGNPFNEFRSSTFSEGYVQETNVPFAETDKSLFDILESRGEMTAEQKRVALGQPPSAYTNLTEAQRKEYDFARSIRISEADALKLAKMVLVGRNV
jgi:hypothetical protein